MTSDLVRATATQGERQEAREMREDGEIHTLVKRTGKFIPHKTIRDAVQHSDALKITMRAIPPERSTKREVKVLLSDCRTPGDETPQLNVKEGINSRLLFCIDVYCDVYRSNNATS
ncbi:hypothetical protein GQ600_16359 [Phytophthora cactorum]|nr:hypothetical protein GQ600_16359 [Phytophthora cactorum]